MQVRRLRKVLTFAYDSCPFYHDLYKMKGFVPEEVRTIDDFRKKVPIITKRDLTRILPRDFTAGICPGELIPNMRSISLTSGVTGLNTFVVTGSDFMDRFVQNYLAREMWMEMLRPNMRVFLQLSGWHFIALSMNRLAQYFSLKVVSPWGTQMYKFAKGYVEMLEESNPDYIVTTPSMLHSVMDECKKEGKEIRRVFENVKYVSVAGEIISPLERSKLVDELGVYDIFESGGSVDGIWGGGECSAHRGHHVWMDHGFLEIVEPETGEPLGTRECGAIVNTHFSLDASIYIRFNSQDYGEMLDGDCECGRTHNRVEIYDRIMNVVTVESKRVSVYDLIACFESIDEISEALFTILLSSDNARDILTLKIAQTPRVKSPEMTSAKLEDTIRMRLGLSSVRISWVPLNEMEFIHGKIVRIKNETAQR